MIGQRTRMALEVELDVLRSRLSPQSVAEEEAPGGAEEAMAVPEPVAEVEAVVEASVECSAASSQV